MPAKLFSSLRDQVEGVRAQRLDFEKTLEPLHKLTSLDSENTARQSALLVQLLENPSDAKILTAYRQAAATAGADRAIFSAAHTRLDELRKGFDVEIADSIVAIGRQALVLIADRLAAEQSEPIPNRQLAEHLESIRRQIESTLAIRTMNPAGLSTVLGIAENSPI